MGLQVIAEGIEDLDQAAWLLDHGCAMAQGYAFGRPAPLPSPTEVLLGELIDAPVEIVAGELMPEPLPPMRMPAPRIDPAAAFHHDFPTDDTGEFVLRRDLMDDLADPDEE
jgi:hypothetical protein